MAILTYKKPKKKQRLIFFDEYAIKLQVFTHFMAVKGG
jgi:hypothetical protein